MLQQRVLLFASAVLAVCICYSSAQQCQVVVPLGMQDRVYGIPDANITASTYFSTSTAPYYARLYYSLGAGAWTANVMDNLEYLQVAVGRKVITGFATQGRRGSNEYVTELYFQFSDDRTGSNWLTYQDIYGQPFLFQAPSTQNDDTPVTFSLTYPVVAQYVRFVPYRWNKLISMRVELYGCDYETWGVVFDGSSQLIFQNSVNGQQFQSYYDTITLRFKTITTNGMLLYASSTQGDYLSVELWKGRLMVSINLGPSDYLTGDNSMIAGSLLDDGRWHDVRVIRTVRMINVSVDRVMVWQDVIGDFYALDVNQNISVGGLSSFYNRRGVHVTTNFTGCMENVMFNQLNMFRDARYQALFDQGATSVTSNMKTPVSNLGRFYTSGNPAYACLLSDTASQYAISIQSYDADFTVATTIGQTFSVSFQFRTFQPGGTLIYSLLGPTGSDVWITLDANCFMYYEVLSGVSGENSFSDTVQNDLTTTGNSKGTFCDGLWHTISLTASKNSILFIYDGQTRSSSQLITITTGTVVSVAGGNPGYKGFQGCLRSLSVNGANVDFTILSSIQSDRVVMGTCVIRDRCIPNPCEHGGVCSQTWTTFSCDCSGTGYTGGVCHISQYPSSCVEAQMYSQTQNAITTPIDLDGNGPLDPFNVTCAFPSATSTNTVLNAIQTLVDHDAESLLTVQNYQNAGSYSKKLNYKTSLDNLNNLILRSLTCRQQITYQCQNSKLFAPPPTTEGGCIKDQPNCYSDTYGWWVGRTGYPLNYWGGSSPETGKCACGVTQSCKVSSGSTGGASGGVGSTNAVQTCNCDATWSGNSDTLWLIDDGYLTYTPDLPVTQVRLGDTGSGGTQGKKGQYKVGPLECYGDTLYDQPVTFRRTDANIEFPPLWSGEAFDIKFQFKTTNVYGVFFQDIGPNDYIDVRMTQANRILFQFDAGSGVQVIQAVTGNNLNDNKWHQIQIERNRLQASLQVDFQAPITLKQGDLYFRPFYFNHNLSVGSSVIFDQGFSGCMRGFTVNGNIYNLYNKVLNKEYTYGLSLGCVQKCTPNPCQYNGECQEFYYGYYCECGRTPARGYICGREVGINLQANMMMKYTFPDTGSNVGSVDEYIKIGFSTQLKQGILMQIINPSLKEYISIYVNGNGGITCEFNFGFGRYEVSTQVLDTDFTNLQLHVVVVSRSNLGKVVTIKVDDYPAATLDLSQWLLSATSDTRLDNPTYIYIGRNESTAVGRGFQGCIYQAQFNNIFPIKAAFNDPPLSYVSLSPDPSQFLEDKCGIEELLPANAPYEIRPLPTPPSNISLLYSGPSISMGGNEGAIIGGVIGGVFLLFIIGLFLFCRAYKLETGAYRTYEEKGDEADTAEAAIRIGETGQPEVGERNEWFI